MKKFRINYICILILLIGQLITISCNVRTKVADDAPEDIQEDNYDVYYSSTYYEPLKYQEKLPNSAFFNDCEDIYNSNLLRTSLFSILEVWWRMEEEHPSAEMLKAIDRLSAESIKNKEVRSSAEIMLDAFKGYFADPTSYMSKDKSIMDAVMEKYYDFDELISKKYNIFSYTDLDEDEYLKEINRLNDLIPNYSELFQLDGTPENLEKIHSLIEQENDFEKKYGYAEIYAYVGGVYYIDVSVFNGIFNQNKYSHKLFPLWRIWRCTIQLQGSDGGDFDYGSSTFAYIPNDLYNKQRKQIALMTLDYLKSHPDDKVAINQYIMLASMPNLKRFGSAIGNGAFEELHNLDLRRKEESKTDE